MNIGILQTAYKKSEEYGAFYNVQELGLGRALANNDHTVTLYKGVDGASSISYECDGRFCIKLVSLKYIGINGLFNPNELDSSLDILIYFCDTQLRVPRVYSWCLKNHVTLYPYIGVINSHSESFIKRSIMNIASYRNLQIYRKCNVYAKTPDIHTNLLNSGCKNVTLLPVGLDESVMNKCFEEDFLSNKHKCVDSLLFIGRMEEEKQPLEMVRIYKELLAYNHELKLTMIGSGYMYDEVAARLNELKNDMQLSENQIALLPKVKYTEMSGYYLSHSCYVNLNKVEILGMSILEAMYYGCPIYAIKAPGPDFLLKEDGFATCGYISSNVDGLIKQLQREIAHSDEASNVRAKNAYRRVRTDFTWTSIVGKLFS